MSFTKVNARLDEETPKGQRLKAFASVVVADQMNTDGDEAEVSKPAGLKKLKQRDARLREEDAGFNHVWEAAAAEVREQLDGQAAELTEVELRLHENPKLASLQGAEAFLISAGNYEPAGSTTKPDADGAVFVPVVEEAKIDWHTKPKDQDPVMYVDVYGNKKACFEIIEKAAARRGEETLICSKGTGSHRSTRYGLTERLNRNEQVALVELGADILDKNRQEITVTLPKAEAAKSEPSAP